MATISQRLMLKFRGLISRIPTSVLVQLNICPCCLQHSVTVAKRRTRTCYEDEESNYETSCIDCYKEHDEYWKERWDEYYAGSL